MGVQNLFKSPLVKKFLHLSIALLLANMGFSQNKFEVFAHRGAMGYEVENSMAAFEKALEMGATRVELDVYLIASGDLVVFHDDNLKRLTGVDADIESFNYHNLNKIKLFNGESIPLLEDVMELLREKVILNIELKGSGTAKPVYDLINELGYDEKQLVISSFKWEELRNMRSFNNNIPIGILTDKNPLDAIPIAKELNAIAINPYYKNTTKELVETIHNKGFKVYCWTVNETRELAHMKAIGVDGVFCNYLDKAEPFQN